MVLWHGRSCKEMRGKILRTGSQNNSTVSYTKVATPCLDDHQKKEEEMGSVWELSKVCSQIVLKCLYLARIGRPDILWSVNKLPRCSSKMDSKLWQTFCAFDLLHSSYMWLQTVLLCGNTQHNNAVEDCFKILILREALKTQHQHQVDSYAFSEVKHLCQSVGMCKKRTSVSHSSTEAEVISLDASLRMWSLGLSDWTISFLTKPNQQIQRSGVTGKPVSEQPHPTWKTKIQLSASIWIRMVLITFRQRWDLFNVVLCYMSLRTMKPWLRG